MPGELPNIVASRVAALFDLHGPSFVADAECASAMAALAAAVDGLVDHDYDMVLTGGIDANMSASTFVKFCKIGALSATGSRPYSDGADGFVMGEGAAVFVLKRLEDAERDGDRIYAVVRGIGASSDGRGKGITAPNPAPKGAGPHGHHRALSASAFGPGPPLQFQGLGQARLAFDELHREGLGRLHLPLRADDVHQRQMKQCAQHQTDPDRAAGLAHHIPELQISSRDIETRPLYHA